MEKFERLNFKTFTPQQTPELYFKIFKKSLNNKTTAETILIEQKTIQNSKKNKSKPYSNMEATLGFAQK